MPSDYRDKKWHAFISYRRGEGGSEAARLLKRELKDKGLNAFLDVVDLGVGTFDDRLIQVIESAPSFLLILTKDCLERCNQEKDWLRRELAHAFRTDRTVIPILKHGFVFPDQDTLPEDIAELSKHNGVKYDHDYFDAMVQRIARYVKQSVTRAEREAAEALELRRVEEHDGPEAGAALRRRYQEQPRSRDRAEAVEPRQEQVLEQRQEQERLGLARRQEQERHTLERQHEWERQQEEERKAREAAEALRRQREEERKAREAAEALLRQREEERKAREAAEALRRQQEEERKAREAAEALRRQREEEHKAREAAEALRRQQEEERVAQEAVHRKAREEAEAQRKAEEKRLRQAERRAQKLRIKPLPATIVARYEQLRHDADFGSRQRKRRAVEELELLTRQYPELTGGAAPFAEAPAQEGERDSRQALREELDRLLIDWADEKTAGEREAEAATAAMHARAVEQKRLETQLAQLAAEAEKARLSRAVAGTSSVERRRAGARLSELEGESLRLQKTLERILQKQAEEAERARLSREQRGQAAVARTTRIQEIEVELGVVRPKGSGRPRPAQTAPAAPPPPQQADPTQQAESEAARRRATEAEQVRREAEALSEAAEKRRNAAEASRSLSEALALWKQAAEAAEAARLAWKSAAAKLRDAALPAETAAARVKQAGAARERATAEASKADQRWRNEQWQTARDEAMRRSEAALQARQRAEAAADPAQAQPLWMAVVAATEAELAAWKNALERCRYAGLRADEAQQKVEESRAARKDADVAMARAAQQARNRDATDARQRAESLNGLTRETERQARMARGTPAAPAAWSKVEQAAQAEATAWTTAAVRMQAAAQALGQIPARAEAAKALQSVALRRAAEAERFCRLLSEWEALSWWDRRNTPRPEPRADE
jgi:hypothetical protein